MLGQQEQTNRVQRVRGFSSAVISLQIMSHKPIYAGRQYLWTISAAFTYLKDFSPKEFC